MQNVLTRPQTMVIRPQGSLNSNNAVDFQRQITTAVLSRDNTALLVDLGQVDTLDCAGLLALVSGMSLAQRLNQRFGLCSVPPAARIVLELTQLDRVFEVFESHDAFEASVA